MTPAHFRTVFLKFFLQKYYQINFRKSQQISGQLNKSTIYGNKMFEATGLVDTPIPTTLVLAWLKRVY